MAKSWFSENKCWRTKEVSGLDAKALSQMDLIGRGFLGLHLGVGGP